MAPTDVPGVYLHAEMSKHKRVVLKLMGIVVEIMCKVNPEYLKYVVYEKNKRCLSL